MVGALELDPARSGATLAGRDAARSPPTSSSCCARSPSAPGRVLSRERLLELVRGSAEESFDRSIDVHISRLRAKLGDDPRQPRWLKTIRGAGYQLVAPERLT